MSFNDEPHPELYLDAVFVRKVESYPITVTTDEAGTVIVNFPPETEIGLSWTWFSVDEVRNGVTLLGGVERLDSVTVTVIDCADVFDKTRATAPVVGFAAVDSRLELLDVEGISTEPGRMKRLNWPIVYSRFGIW
jgi:hypothetical protein